MWRWSDLKRLIKRAPMRDTADLGAIMWPVVYPYMGDPKYQPKDAHVTVVVFTDINDDNLGFTREDVIEAIQSTLWDVYLWLKPAGIEWFGENKNVPVLRVEHDYLPVYQKSVKAVLAARGIPVDDTFPEYKPHVTITPEAALDGIYPHHMLAGPVELWWGDEKFQIAPKQVTTVVLNNDGLL